MRCSTKYHKLIPCLDGQRHYPYGNTVYYTTRALFDEAERRCEARDAAHAADTDELTELLRRGEAAGLPAPVRREDHHVTYGLDEIRVLVGLIAAPQAQGVASNDL